MNKREIAIASVHSQMAEHTDDDFDLNISTAIVDNLIRDGIISLTYAGVPEISEAVDAFQIFFGTTATLKTDRFAAARLVKRYGAALVIEVIENLGNRKSEKYAPVVNNISQLEAKWPSVLKFISNDTGRLDV